ncbi:NAD(P)H-hydrate dehydratase [Ideonella sp. BN130291]|uniref:NAD(P)H-hydrate dehydratase n=1 Tax=Ideonella sp. BN130291 TaxID=3112940 RepID=UPI002E255499|nr:NAD(P)H-hydrate dehydratase [Ideonella sp. BN130291]
MSARQHELDDAALRAWPLPEPDDGADKEERGRVLVIAGCAEMPGAAVLAATAALRAGAGKLVVATPACIAPWVAASLPEARVIGLVEDERGELQAEQALERLHGVLAGTAAVLVGPGMVPEAAAVRLVRALRPALGDTPLLLDAAAMAAVREGGDAPAALGPHTLLTPHAGEMAHLLGQAKEALVQDPRDTALRAAHQWQCVVALKGAETWIATPGGDCWRHARGNVGLATSGSGDVLAGLVAGLLARGAPPAQAAAWGVALHARAGERLAERVGPLGYLARELAAEVPRLMGALRAQAGAARDR